VGRKNVDRVHISHFRHRVATVADMQDQRWDVISKCRVCGLMMAVDLALITKHSGPKTILWNRLARCKRIGCQGHVEFQADPLAAGSMQPSRPVMAERINGAAPFIDRPSRH
jgi:hypothetical protein